MMFDDRAWGWKFALSLAAAACLGVLAAQRGASIKPSLSRCLAQPEHWDGTRLWVTGGSVSAAASDSWTLAADDRRIHVAGPPPAPAGTPVSVAGTFRAAGPRLDDARAGIRPSHPWIRRGMEALSLLVALLVLLNAARAFRFEPRRLQLERRD